MLQAKQQMAEIRVQQKGGAPDAERAWQEILVTDPESIPAKRAIAQWVQ
jgi:hypothetical protein